MNSRPKKSNGPGQRAVAAWKVAGGAAAAAIALVGLGVLVRQVARRPRPTSAATSAAPSGTKAESARVRAPTFPGGGAFAEQDVNGDRTPDLLIGCGEGVCAYDGIDLHLLWELEVPSESIRGFDVSGTRLVATTDHAVAVFDLRGAQPQMIRAVSVAVTPEGQLVVLDPQADDVWFRTANARGDALAVLHLESGHVNEAPPAVAVLFSCTARPRLDCPEPVDFLGGRVAATRADDRYVVEADLHTGRLDLRRATDRKLVLWPVFAHIDSATVARGRLFVVEGEDESSKHLRVYSAEHASALWDLAAGHDRFLIFVDRVLVFRGDVPGLVIVRDAQTGRETDCLGDCAPAKGTTGGDSVNP